MDKVYVVEKLYPYEDFFEVDVAFTTEEAAKDYIKRMQQQEKKMCFKHYEVEVK